MLKEARLPMEFWDEAAEADVYLRNRTNTGPTIDDRQVSPEEAFTGTIPSIDYIRVWGSKCYSHINPKTIPSNQRHDKLVDRGRVGVFMGYSDTTTKQLKVYSPELGYTFRTSRVIVDEETAGGTIDLRIRNCKVGPQGTPNVLEDRRPRGRPKRELAVQPVNPIAAQPTSPTTPKTIPVVEIPPFVPPPNIPKFSEDDDIEGEDGKANQSTTKDESQSNSEEIPTPRKDDSTRMAGEMDSPRPTSLEPDVQMEEAPRYFTRSKRKRSNSLNEEDERLAKIVKAMLAQLQQAKTETAFPAQIVQGIKIPLTYKEAINDPKYSEQWKAAMREEMLSLAANGTWKEVIPPKGANQVSTKWVYTIKTKVDGTIERFKARLVARGFSQVYGQDYTDTFALTVRMDTLRLFLAMVAREDLDCSHFDIKNAFTESHLAEEIYLSPPNGMEIKKGYVLQALKSLYGLKQAARDWNLLCKKNLLKWGFKQSLADPCLFIHQEREIQLLIYVDDILAAAKNQEQID
jgi:hypothetical protein